MAQNLSALKKLAVCLGCCKSTKDNPAETTSDAIEFICENISLSGVSDITINLAKSGKIVGGTWTDSAGKVHEINIV